jgi:hypothetical protein
LRPVLSALLLVTALLLAFAAPALGHVGFVDPPGQGEFKAQWLGGPTDSEGVPVGLPGNGKALLDSPVGKLTPSHARGQVTACYATVANPSAIVILAPPYFTSCHHGQP